MSFVKKARFKNRGRVVSGIAGIFTAAMLVFALVSCEPGVDPAPAPVVPVITITSQPAETTTVTQGDISGTLSVAAEVTEGAALSYQWYSNTEAGNQGGEAVTGATSANFTIPTDLTEGTYYYFCEASAAGADSVRSEAAKVTVKASGTVIPVITIKTQPAETTTVTQGSISGTLSVAAEVKPAAALSYRWYSNTEASNQGGEAIADAKAADFTIPAALTEGTYYYYCEVIAEGADTKRSNAATVVVNEPFVPPFTPSDLTVNTWADGMLPADGDKEQWFRFTATAGTQYVHVKFGVLADLYVQVFDSAGQPVGSISNLYASTTYKSLGGLTVDQTYYIRVWPYGSLSGDYKIMVNETASSMPEGTIPEPVGDNWKQGNIAAGGEEWFTFTASAVSQYVHAKFGGLTGLNAAVFDSAGQQVGSVLRLHGSTTYSSLTGLTVDQTYYIRVWPYDSGYFGDYEIMVNETASLMPDETIPEPVGDNWKQGNIAAGGEEWFTFTASAARHYIHVKFGGLSDLNMQVFDSAWQPVGISSTLYNSTTYKSLVGLTVDQTYYIRVWPYYSGVSGDYEITVNESAIVPGTEVKSLASGWNSGNIAAGGNEWFTFTASAASQYVHVKFGGLTDIYVQVFDGAWQPVGSGSNLYVGTTYKSLDGLTVDQTYYIRVWPYNSVSGDYEIAVNESAAPPAN